jgi:glycerate-2-kinase
MKIFNYEELIYSTPSQELQKLRNHLLSILESSLDSVNSQKMVVKSVILRNGKLIVNDQCLDLLDFENIFVIGGGKACGGMCKAIEDLLGDFITGGVVNVLSGTEEEYQLNKIELVGASHPIPNENGINGVKKMVELLSGITRRDLVIVLISGGGSALMPFPADEISIKDIQIITEKLLLNGATINELNIVRKHLSGWKGGQLAKICYPAMVVTLILSDVVDNKLDVIASGPTVPDSSTFSDTKDVLVKYGMWNSVSPFIKERISKGVTGEIKDTPKKGNMIFERVRNHVIGSNKIVCEAALETAKKLGYKSRIISTSLVGEAREIGKKIAN